MNIDATTLPPLLAQILAWVTLALTLLTAFAHGLTWIVPRLRVIASRTKTTRDDAFVDWIARAAVSFSAVLDAVQVVIPRVQLGEPAKPLAPTVPPANGPAGSA